MKPNFERLQKIVDYCEENFEKLEPTFDFSTVVDSHSCGTVGCLMGKFHLIFPEYFRLTSPAEGVYNLNHVNGYSVDSMVNEFLGLPKNYELPIFYGKDEDDLPMFDPCTLRKDASLREVIDNLKLHIEKWKHEQTNS